MPCVYVGHKESKQTHPVTKPVTHPTEKSTGVPETQLLEFAVGAAICAAIVGGALYFLLKR